MIRSTRISCTSDVFQGEHFYEEPLTSVRTLSLSLRLSFENKGAKKAVKERFLVLQSTFYIKWFLEEHLCPLHHEKQFSPFPPLFVFIL